MGRGRGVPPSPTGDPAARAHTVAALRAAGCVFAEDEAELLLGAARDRDELAGLVARRVGGLPLEQVLGWSELAGVRVNVEPGVFVPRRRSELLVACAVAVAPAGGAVVLDLCCGSGAVGLAVAVALRARACGGTGDVLELHAADSDPVAVRCARRNLAAVAGQVHQGDLYAALPAGLLGRVDVLVANAPYVPTGEIALLPPEARLHEPGHTLDGGADGGEVQRRVAAGAHQWLAPGGHLLLETSARQCDATAAAVARGGLLPRVESSDELDATVVLGTLPGV